MATQTMKAAQFHGKEDVRVESTEIPTLKDGQILLKVAWCGLCGSDVKCFLTDMFGSTASGSPILPFTLGHEFCGVVHQAPDGAPFKVGDAISVDPRLYCGSCVYCKEGATNLCLQGGFVGISKPSGGGLSEYVALDYKHCHPIPKALIDTAALIEPLAVSRRGMKRCRFDDWSGKSALILGGGPIGQAMICNLKVAGCTKIFCSEITAMRKEQAASLGATVLDPSKDKIVEDIMAKTDGVGVNACFDCAGVPSALETGLQTLRKHGVFVMVASYFKPFNIDWQTWVMKELTLEGSLAYDNDDYKSVVEDFVQGRFSEAEKMISTRLGLDDVVSEGLIKLRNGAADRVKILIDPSQ